MSTKREKKKITLLSYSNKVEYLSLSLVCKSTLSGQRRLWRKPNYEWGPKENIESPLQVVMGLRPSNRIFSLGLVLIINLIIFRVVINSFLLSLFFMPFGILIFSPPSFFLWFICFPHLNYAWNLKNSIFRNSLGNSKNNFAWQKHGQYVCLHLWYENDLVNNLIATWS